MKKLLSLILVTAMLVTAFSSFSVSVSADFPKADEVMNGYENLLLTYTYNPNGSNNGRFSPNDFKPYVGYYDQQGNLKDFFFDSYLFLPCMAYGVSGARLHYDTANPTKAIDWVDYVNDTFAEGTNVDALETAFGEVKQKLGDSERKAGVVFSILYPAHGQSDFGELGGKKLDFTKLEDRKYAIKWIIDEQLKLYNDRGYEHLDLIGFYWLEEYVVTHGNKEENRQLYQYAGDYLHSLGLKFIWIPWYQANGYKEWKDLGFDAVCMQPNMFWETVPTKNRVEDTVAECKLYGMGTEMEVDNRALLSGEYYNRYLDYLQGGMNGGAMNSLKMYYQDARNGVYYKAWEAKDERSRSIYDLTYKYAKGTLTQEDIVVSRSPEFSISEDVNWRSHGKKYVATKAYSDGNGAEYQNINGKELTDGVIGYTELGTEWHGFHKSLLDPDGRMSVTVDLGAIYKDLTHFMAHFSHIQNYGIDDPADVRISVSTDGESFTEIAAPELEFSDIAAYVSYHCEPVSAQYIKFSFTNSTSNFVFCSEVLVGAGDPPSQNGDSSKNDSATETESATDNESGSDESVSEPTTDNNGSNWYIWVIAGVLVAVAAVVAVTVLNKKKKQ